MELRHLRYFIAVAEAKTFTRAAEQLGIQQPPLSQQIKSLENEIGFSLFHRMPKGIELSVGGKVFYAEARAILASVKRASQHASSAAHGRTGKLSLGFTTSTITHWLAPRLIGGFRQAFPDIELEFQEGSAAKLIESVTSGSLDVGLLRTPVSRPDGVSFQCMLKEQMLFALPATHPIACTPRIGKNGKLATLSLRALKDERFILTRRHGAAGMYADLVSACERVGFVPQIAAEVENMLTNVALVAAGVGVSAVPESMRGIHTDNVAYFRPKEASQLAASLNLAYLSSMPNPTVARFLAFSDRIQAE
jgi:DNA-binding transcriptional LysR family regulator